MKHRLLAGVCVVWVGLVFGALCNAQSIQATQVLTPTPVSTDDLRVFPGDLLCNKQPTSLINNGPSWMGITIGQSTLADVEQLLSTLSDDYVFIDGDDYDTRFVILDLNQRDPDIPSSVRLCLEDDTVQALAIGYFSGLQTPRTNLSDLVAQFGKPDAITWTDNPASRIAFWFEQGLAADVTVLPNEPGYQPIFGRVEVEIYFPHQVIDGYENRWPYNQTRKFNIYLASPEDPSVDFGPENPFDFEAIVATITAEPSRTPTPTSTATAP